MSRSLWFSAATLLVALALGCVRPVPPRSSVQLAVLGPTQLNIAPTTRPTVPPTQRADAEPVKPPPGAPVIATNNEAGVISGQVRWEGPTDSAALPARLSINPDNRGIANVVVWSVAAPAEAAPATGAEVQLLQRNGEFVPRVQAVARGSSLLLRSADEKASFKAAGAADFSCLVNQGKSQKRLLNGAGLVEIRSELEPRAVAYIWVFDGPAFTVTDADGRFRLPDLAPGKCELTLWHEGWRRAGDGFPEVRKRCAVELGKDHGASIQWPLSGRDLNPSK